MALVLNGRIQSSTGFTDTPAECRVDVMFNQAGVQGGAASRIPDTRAPVDINVIRETTPAALLQRQVRLSTRTDAQGHFSVALPDGMQIAGGPLQVVVASPAGQQIGVSSFPANDLPDVLLVTVDSKAIAAISLAAPPAALPPRTRHITGRVFDRSGKRIPTGLQIMIYAQKPAGGGAAAPDLPVLVLRTEVSGYFAGEAPSDQFEKASALVAGIGTGFPVALENGFLPKNLPIVIDWAEPESSGSTACSHVTPRTPTHEDIDNNPDAYSSDLGTGRCVQFTVPNRSIEEFDFYTVVRTTEPDIVAFNASNEKPVGVTRSDLVLASLQSAIDTALLARNAALISVATATQELATLQSTTTASIPLKEAYELLVARYYGMVWADLNALIEKRKTGTWDPDTERSSLSAELYSRAGIPVASAGDIAQKLIAMVQAYTPEVLKDTHGDLAHSILSSAAFAGTNDADRAAHAVAEAAEKVKSATASLAEHAHAVEVATAALNNKKAELAAQEQGKRRTASIRPPGRVPLSAKNAIDWDDTPTFYQTAEIAHGHLLHFKQTWYADGFSLGDLLYSLPLAPGQKKMVSIVDWERREQAARSEDTVSNEGVSAAITRDRDLGEVITGALSESSRGGSKSTTAGVGAGTGGAGNGSYQGFNFGALLGVSGGYGEANSSAWQDSSKNIASDSLQTLRDRTLQSASAVRSLRSSVVSAVSQGESVRATTEVVANHNHCHALTIQYFEVLRHLKLRHDLVDVQECLFIPLPMSEFDLEKALRWRQELRAYLQRPQLAGAFDAARRVLTSWSQVVMPLERYADEFIQSVSGDLLITVLVPLPPFPELPKPRPEETAAQTAQAIADAVNPTTGFLGVVLAIATGGASLIAGATTTAAINASKAAAMGARSVADALYAETNPQERYKKYHQEIVPGVVEGFIDQLELHARMGPNLVHLGSADFTLASEYQPGVPLAVSLRASLNGHYKRSDISELVIASSSGLPRSFRAIVNSANIRYRTSSFEHSFVNDPKVNDDIDPPTATAVISGFGDIEIRNDGLGKGASLYTPIDEWEQRKPRVEDQRLATELIEHLNNNFEYYHHAIWWTMDPNRRFMLMDGFFAPGSRNRSVASVVENRVIGIVGNSVVMPVARGVHLDPRFAPDKDGNRVDLVQFYRLDSPVPPVRVSLPTRGVFAEAVMGSCNACEKIDDSRFWRWEESPIDEPAGIEPISMSTRRAEPVSTLPSPFPAPIVSIQNAPAIPDPTGVRAALDALGKQTFADITGLAGTQANAAAAYQQALDTALKFGQEAAALAKQAAMLNSKDKVMSTIDEAEDSGKISHEDAKDHRNNTLGAMTFSQPPMTEAVPSTPEEWNPWPGETETPPKPKPKPKQPTPLSNTEDVVDVKLKLRAFVPAKVWIPEFTSTFAFNGDDRAYFHPINGSSRAEAEVSLRVDRKQFKVLEKNIGPSVFGKAEIYLRLNTSPVGGGKPFWWLEKSNPTNQSLVGPRTLDNKDGLLVEVVPQTSSIEIAFKLQAKPYFPYTLPDLQDLRANAGSNVFVELAWPDMDADIVVRILNQGHGSLIYTVTGHHDTFPSYELYVNGEAAYTHDSSSVEVPDGAMRFPQKTIVPDPIFRPLKIT